MAALFGFRLDLTLNEAIRMNVKWKVDLTVWKRKNKEEEFSLYWICLRVRFYALRLKSSTAFLIEIKILYSESFNILEHIYEFIRRTL